MKRKSFIKSSLALGIVDLDRRLVEIRMFKYLWSRDDIAWIDNLEKFTSIII